MGVGVTGVECLEGLSWNFLTFDGLVDDVTGTDGEPAIRLLGRLLSSLLFFILFSLSLLSLL